MAVSQIGRVHGQVATGAFYGYTPLVVKVAATGKFTVATGGGTSAITEGGYDKAVRALQTVASIVWLGAQADDNFCAIIDQPSANQGDGVAGSGVTTGFAALKAALVANCGGSSGDYTITTSSALNGAGTFTFA